MHTFVDVKFTSIVHEHKEERKFLGIIIHENLSWKPRITSICDKVAKVIGKLSTSRRYLGHSENLILFLLSILYQLL